MSKAKKPPLRLQYGASLALEVKELLATDARWVEIYCENENCATHIETPKQAREVARWLLRFADWAEEKETP